MLILTGHNGGKTARCSLNFSKCQSDGRLAVDQDCSLCVAFSIVIETPVSRCIDAATRRIQSSKSYDLFSGRLKRFKGRMYREELATTNHNCTDKELKDVFLFDFFNAWIAKEAVQHSHWRISHN